MSELRHGGGHTPSDPFSQQDEDPLMRLDVFQNHWKQAWAVMSCQDRKTTAANGQATTDGVETVLHNLEQMVALLVMEHGSDGLPGPILSHILQHDLLEKICTWCTINIPCHEQLRMQQLRLFEMLINQTRQLLLVHRPVMKPLLRLLVDVADSHEMADQELEFKFVLVLHQICICVCLQLPVRDTFFSSDGEHGLSPFLVFSHLIPYVHREGAVGEKARDALLLVMTLSARDPQVGHYIATVSDFCPVLATGLGGLFSSLPRRIVPPFEDWHLITHEDCERVPDLQMFLNSLQFCNAVVEVAHPLVRDQLIEFIYSGFLVPILAPALHQDIPGLPVSLLDTDLFRVSREEVIAATAYLDLFIRHVTDPHFLKAVLKFVLKEKYDDVLILDSLLSRIGSNSRLSAVTLSLFHTLIDLNCEDVMFQLVFRYLVPCTHVMVSQRRSVNDLDLYSKSAEKFMSLRPSCCTRALPQGRTEAQPAAASAHLTSTKRTSNTSRFRSNSASHAINPVSNVLPITMEVSSTQCQGETNYFEYLHAARMKLEQTSQACSRWLFLYDGESPAPDINLNSDNGASSYNIAVSRMENVPSSASAKYPNSTAAVGLVEMGSRNETSHSSPSINILSNATYPGVFEMEPNLRAPPTKDSHETVGGGGTVNLMTSGHKPANNSTDFICPTEMDKKKSEAKHEQKVDHKLHIEPKLYIETKLEDKFNPKFYVEAKLGQNVDPKLFVETKLGKNVDPKFYTQAKLEQNIGPKLCFETKLDQNIDPKLCFDTKLGQKVDARLYANLHDLSSFMDYLNEQDLCTDEKGIWPVLSVDEELEEFNALLKELLNTKCQKTKVMRNNLRGSQSRSLNSLEAILSANITQNINSGSSKFSSNLELSKLSSSLELSNASPSLKSSNVPQNLESPKVLTASVLSKASKNSEMSKISTNSEHTNILTNTEHTDILMNPEEKNISINAEHTHILTHSEETIVLTDTEHRNISTNPEETNLLTDTEHTNILTSPEHTNVPTSHELSEVSTRCPTDSPARCKPVFEDDTILNPSKQPSQNNESELHRSRAIDVYGVPSDSSYEKIAFDENGSTNTDGRNVLIDSRHESPDGGDVLADSSHKSADRQNASADSNYSCSNSDTINSEQIWPRHLPQTVKSNQKLLVSHGSLLSSTKSQVETPPFFRSLLSTSEEFRPFAPPSPGLRKLRYLNDPPNIGPFLSALLSRLEGMITNSLYFNLLLTGLLSRLAAYPQPLLRSFLFNHNLVFQPSVRSLVQVLSSLKQKLESFSITVKQFDSLVANAKQSLIKREEEFFRQGKATSQEGRSLPSSSIKLSSEDTAATTNSKGTRKMSLRNLLFRRSVDKGKGILSRGKNKKQEVIRHSQVGGENLSLDTLSSSNSQDNSNNNLHSLSTWNAVYCALVLDEFLKELAALSQEHSVLYVDRQNAGR